MGDGPECGNTRIERLLREEAMKAAKRGVGVPVIAVKPAGVSTIAVRRYTLGFGTRAWGTVNWDTDFASLLHSVSHWGALGVGGDQHDGAPWIEMIEMTIYSVPQRST